MLPLRQQWGTCRMQPKKEKNAQPFWNPFREYCLTFHACIVAIKIEINLFRDADAETGLQTLKYMEQLVIFVHNLTLLSGSHFGTWFLKIKSKRFLIANENLCGSKWMIYQRYSRNVFLICSPYTVYAFVFPFSVQFFMNDEDFVNNISRNTSRYVRHFEDCADRLMPPISADVRAPEKDVFDILQVHYNLRGKYCIFLPPFRN